ncbi:MAG: hypothetical protein OEX21_04450 [Betaproteobacteria bacterium]|nr:hypothetical protein [Betaproteobacteria bacterium]
MSPQAATRDERALFLWASACAALVFVVVASSAWLRIVAAPCPPAGCEGFGPADAVRIAHRVAAMGVTVLALVIAALAWKAPARADRRVASVLLLVLVAALALVGRRSAGSAPPAVLVANLLGGLALLAFTAGLAATARQPRARVPPGIALASALFAAAAATGGVLSAAAPADPAALAFAHRALAWATLAAWSLAAVRPPAAPGTRLVAALVAGQALLAIALPGEPIARWLHNLLTAAAACAVVFAALASRSAPSRDAGLSGGVPIRS